MPELKYPLTQAQKKTRPKFEDVAGDFLPGDRLKYALDFAAFLRENNANPAWASTNSWNSDYKGQRLCSIHIPYDPYTPLAGTGTWIIRPAGWYGGEFENFITNDKDKEIMWSCVKQCHACYGRYTGKKRPCNFAQGNDKEIFGRLFKSVCGYLVIMNPGGDVLDFAKKWVEAKIKTLT